MIFNPELYFISPDGNETIQTNKEQEEYKLVLVVRSDLRMSAGKVAAQCVHAALGVVDRVRSSGKLLTCAEVSPHMRC